MKKSSKLALLLLSFLLVGNGVFLDLPLSTIGASSFPRSSAPADTVINGAPIRTQNDCGPSAITDVQVLSRRAQPEVGQTFHLLLSVAAVNRCGTNQNQSFGVNLKLPEGVEVDPVPGVSGCIVFRSTTPSFTSARACRRTGAGSGFERVDPIGGNQWSLRPGGTDTVQVQLAVRARTAGQKTFVGRICDTMSSLICQGDPPVANAIPFVDFAVAAPPTTDPQKVHCVVGGPITSSSIQLLAARFPRNSGTLRIQRRGPGASDFSTISTLEMSNTKLQHATTATGLSPATTYSFRACFTPTFGTQVCGGSIRKTTRAR